MNHRSIQPDRPQNFFRNYNRVIGAAYGTIVLGLLLVFIYHLNEKAQEEVAVVKAHVERHAQFIEFVLRASTDQLEGLRMSVTGREKDSQADVEQVLNINPSLAVLLQASSSAQGFHLDALPDRDAGANIVGSGSLTGREPAFYRDMSIATALFPGLRALTFNLPSAAQAGYISGNNFTTMAPWMKSSDRPFKQDIYKSPVWTLGVFSAASDRAKYWAPPYFASKDQGLLVPAAAPVYQAGQFAGVITVDTSLDYLNRINSEFAYPLGAAFMVDVHGKVLAHPRLYANPLSVDKAPDLRDALPPELALLENKLLAIPQGKYQTINGQIVMRHGFVSAPWQLIYSVPVSDIWRKLMVERGAAMAAVLIGLSLMMLVTYTVTSREFVGPAAKLVQHLAAESRFVPTRIPAVPSAWRPWFETVSKAFRESMQLMGLRQELEIAAKMQIAILPRHWPEDTAFTLWGTMLSAREVGGDFYDHFRVADNRLGMVVADVSGKGVPAALFCMVSKTLLRTIAMRGRAVASEAIKEVNEGLCEDNDSCMFVTAFYAVLDPVSGFVEYVNAGHPLPLVLHADGGASYLPGTSGLALGVMEGVHYHSASVSLKPGEVLLMFTDGVTEAMNTRSEEFGCERLLALFDKPGHAQLSEREAVEKMVTAVHAFADGAEQSDDLTCMALRYHGQRQNT